MTDLTAKSRPDPLRPASAFAAAQMSRDRFETMTDPAFLARGDDGVRICDLHPAAIAFDAQFVSVPGEVGEGFESLAAHSRDRTETEHRRNRR